VWAIFMMQDYLLTALKRATVVPVENLIFALLKMGLLVAAVGMSYVFGIAVSWVVATVVIVAAVNVYLLVRAIPQQATGEPVEPVRPRAVARFVRSDYAGATLWQIAMNGLPALVLARLGAEDAAVYGIVWTITVSLYLIPSGMGQSMIAHTAGDPAQAAVARRAMVRRSLALVVPAAGVLSVGAYPVLWLFGEHYAQEGAWALAIASLSAIPQVLTAAAVAQARVQQRMRVLVLVPGSLAVAVLLAAWLLMPVLGITGVALAWLAVQSVGAVVLLLRNRAA
jgi:O-antigen/teichoic acid export membrane protein